MATDSVQAQVYVQPAPAVAGDWASGNPRYFVDSGPGGLIVDTGGVTIGGFAWLTSTLQDANGANMTVGYGSGVPDGIIHRQQQGLITTYLAEYGMVIPAGFGVAICNAGDLWVKNSGSQASDSSHNIAYAKNSDGTIIFDATGQSHAGYTETKWVARSVGAQNELVKVTRLP